MRCVVGIFVCFVAVIGWWLARDKNKNVNDLGEIIVRENTEEPLGIRFLTPNPMTLEYGQEDFAPKNDLVVVQEILLDCQLYFKNFDEFHLPDNQAVTGFLQGKNPEGLVWIPSDHPSVGGSGELLDRMGRPLIFHRLDGFRFELRSAGPDGIGWTEDDLVLGEAKNH